MRDAKPFCLIATGRDTFSKLTFDKARKAIQEGGVPIYAISMLQAFRIMADQYMGPMQRMDFLQADNEMNTFARETGGQAFFPRFFGEYPGIFQDISTGAPQSVFHRLPSFQPGQGRKIPQDQSGAGESGERRGLEDRRREAQADQVFGDRQGRLHSAAEVE